MVGKSLRKKCIISKLNPLPIDVGTPERDWKLLSVGNLERDVGCYKWCASIKKKPKCL